MTLLGGFIVPHPPLIIPEIGRGEEQQIQATITAYQTIGRTIAALQPDTIVIITPHSVLYRDYLHISPGTQAVGDFSRFGQPKVRFTVRYDSDFVARLVRLSEEAGIPAGTLGEGDPALDHGTMIPLHFINQYYHNYQVVRISISGLSLQTHYQFGKLIAQAAAESGKQVVIVASGDLSHRLKEDGPYGFAEEGPVFDREVTQAMETGDFARLLQFEESFCQAAAECGLRSFIILAGALAGKAVEPELLSYEGPFGVGYAVAAFKIIGDEYVRLARMALEHYVKHRCKLPRPERLSPELVNQRAGVFVSLHLGGELRGCIGTISPTTDCIADEIIQNAISAGMRDPRFPPVLLSELSEMEYSVDVLAEPEPVQSTAELDPKRYGVIVSAGSKRSLLLPNLEGVDTVEEQLRIALLKAGISPDEEYQISRFEVVRHQ